MQVTDGQCASTCGIMANLLVRQMKVKTVVAGGRPSLSPMAVIGGTQGGQIEYFPLLTEAATTALGVAANASSFSSSDVQQLKRTLEPITLAPPMTPFRYEKGMTASVNLLNTIAQGDTQEVPLQFTKIPADCRVFYTPADILSVHSLWRRVAAGLKSGGAGLCINGTVAAWQGNGTANTGGYATSHSQSAYRPAASISALLGLVLAVWLAFLD